MGRFFSIGFVLQVIAIVHFIRRRPDNYWIWIILFFGPIGATVYILMEMVPDFGLARDSFKGVSRRKRIRMLEALVLDNPSAGNYEELGDLLLEEKKYAKARECFDRALSSRTDSIDPLADFQHVVKVDPRYDFSRARLMYAPRADVDGDASRRRRVLRCARPDRRSARARAADPFASGDHAGVSEAPRAAVAAPRRDAPKIGTR